MNQQNRLSQGEFIAIMGMVMAVVAFSIDAMLPGLPEIAAELTPDAPNRAQFMVTSFILGMGLGTLIVGPASDSYGRKPVLLAGAIVYIIASAFAWRADSLNAMLAARVVMGIGASAPRVVALAIVRDLYAGPLMARMMSFIILVFSLIPALAPSLGHMIMEAFGWRSIFVGFALFMVFSGTWLMMRQPETLRSSARRPISLRAMGAAAAEIFGHHTARLSILVQSLTMGMLFTVLSATQQIFDVTFGQGDVFHLWFGGIAVVAASSSILNAQIVMRFGMRAIIKVMYAAQVFLSLGLIMITALDLPYAISFGAFVFWVTCNFFQAGMTLGNLNALAMEEMGHIAGFAASIIMSISTVGAVLLAAPIAILFDGTAMPMAIGVMLMAAAAFALTTMIRRPSDAND